MYKYIQECLKAFKIGSVLVWCIRISEILAWDRIPCYLTMAVTCGVYNEYIGSHTHGRQMTPLLVKVTLSFNVKSQLIMELLQGKW